MDVPFDRDQYVNAIAQSLYEAGSFAYYTDKEGQRKPKGTLHPEWPASEGGHTGPGIVAFLGDTGYKTATLKIDNLNPENYFIPEASDLHLRIASLRKGIDTYVEQGGFAFYARDFCEHLEDSVNSRALAYVIDTMSIDMGVFSSEQVRAAIRTKDHDTLRQMLLSCEINETGTEYPELLTSLIILQGIHASFIDRLSEFINVNETIPGEEKQNAQYFLMLIKENFASVAALQFMLPMILLENETLIQQDDGNLDPAMRYTIMQQAIKNMWQCFEEVNILDSEETLPLTGSVVSCPANHHLDGMAKNQLIEHIYAAVVSHADSPEVSSLMQRVQDKAEDTGAATMRRLKRNMGQQSTISVLEKLGYLRPGEISVDDVFLVNDKPRAAPTPTPAKPETRQNGHRGHERGQE